jgi:hypothetical protein
LSG